jgi:phosphatidylserine/phosphatidylglycerophosphate/cardiolipin synthase-like enzyme
MHDIQAVVSGPVAQVLGEHARRRWRRLTGEKGPVASVGSDPWPTMVRAELHDVEVGVVRTRAQYGELAEVRETERLLRSMIEAASEHIFIENQYLSAEGIGRALAARLAEEDPPSVVAITSKASEGWLEQQTIDALRTRWCRELRDADHCERFGAYYPVNAASEPVIVHSKLVVVDDELLYLGSANLANRSMALDTECGLAVDATDRPDIRDAITSLTRRLLAEHLGIGNAAFWEQERTHTLKAAVDARAGGARTLEPLPLDGPEISDVMEPIVELADPDQALSLSHLVRELTGADPKDF